MWHIPFVSCFQLGTRTISGSRKETGLCLVCAVACIFTLPDLHASSEVACGLASACPELSPLAPLEVARGSASGFRPWTSKPI